MAFPSTGLLVTIEAAFGADRTADPSSWSWTDLTSRWHVPEDLTVFIGRKNNAKQAEASEISFALKNDDGELTPDDARSQWYPHVDEGLPIRLTLDPELPGEEALEFTGFANAITPRWPAGSAKQVFVTVVASGVIRQHGRGASPLYDSLRRFARLNGAAAYWPLDDPAGSREGRPVIGQHPMRVSANRVIAAVDGDIPLLPVWSVADIAPWLGRAMELERFRGQIAENTFLNNSPEMVAAVDTTGEELQWAVDYMIRGNPGSTPVGILAGNGLGDVGDLQFSIVFGSLPDSGEIDVRVADGSGLVLDFGSYPAPQLWANGDLHHVRVRMVDGPNFSWELHVDGELVASDTASGGLILPPLRQIRLVGPVSPPGTRVLFGRVVAWAGVIPTVADTYAAANGHLGEPAGERAQRLSDEEGVPITIVGTAADTEPMGRQQPATLLTLLRECEATDRGILAEHGFGYWFRIRASRYNQDSALTIDADGRELALPFAPTRDDQRIRNEWTIDQSGALESVTVADLADQQRRGRRDDRATVNVASPARLVDQGTWRLSESTTPGMRHPELAVNLHAAPQLLAEVMAVRLGDRVQAVNLPPQYPPGGLDQVVEGIRHTIRGRRWWRWAAVVSPYAPWQVGVYGEDGVTPAADAAQRYDTDGSAAVGAFQAGTDTALTVATTRGPLWTTDVDDLPLDIVTAGVQLRVTAIGGQAATLRSVSSAASGTTGAWTLAAPAGLQPGDVLVAFQASDIGPLSDMTLTGGAPWLLLGEIAAVDGNGGLRVWWKAAGSEPANYDLTQTSSPFTADGVAAIAAVAGGRPVTPHVAVQQHAGIAIVVPTPSTGPLAGSVELRWAQAEAGTAWTPPGGFTEQVDVASGSFVTGTLASRDAPAGQTGSHNFVTSASVADRIGATVNVVGVQAFTVEQQPVNGVEKTIADGEDVRLAHPARYAL